MQTVDLVAAMLRGDRAAAARLALADPADVRRTALAHGVLPLLVEHLGDSDASALGRACAEDLRAHAVADMRREQDLRRLLAACAQQGVDVVLFKGAHLAYSHYPRPDLRPRLDTDLLIDHDARDRAHAVLVREGYRPSPHVSGDFVIQQAAYEREEGGAVTHVVDLHWQIANPHLFAQVLSPGELIEASTPLPALGASARAVCDVHALVLACVHRVAHHANSDRLIWLYDVHLIASRLDASAWSRFADLVHERGVALVCRRGLEQAAALFGTAVPSDLLHDRRLDPGTHAGEASAAFLDQSRRPVEIFLSDLRTLSTWRRRVQLVREHLFPPADYMQSVYAPSSKAPLAWLYARRAWRGARKWLVRG